MSKDERKYAGTESKLFWKRIAEIENRRTRELVYIAGCALQDHEERMFQMLEAASR